MDMADDVGHRTGDDFFELYHCGNEVYHGAVGRIELTGLLQFRCRKEA
jgi:hypothetical protein